MRPSVRQTQDCALSGCSWVPSGGRDARMAAHIILWWKLSSCNLSGKCYMRVGVWCVWDTKSWSHNYQSVCALKLLMLKRLWRRGGGGGGVSVDICAKSSRKVACFNHNASNKSNFPGSPSSTPFKLLGCKITGEKACYFAKVGWATRQTWLLGLAPPGGKILARRIVGEKGWFGNLVHTRDELARIFILLFMN